LPRREAEGVPVSEEDFKRPAAQRRSWRIQRTAWMLMGILLVVALAGGLGQGPLSHALVRSADGRLEIRYDRIWRVNSPQTLDVRVDAGESKRPSLLLDLPFLTKTTLERVTPAPEATQVGAAGHRLVFASSDGGPLFIRLQLSARALGRLRARLSAADGPPLLLDIIVLP
jgi:hypothetical protein